MSLIPALETEGEVYRPFFEKPGTIHAEEQISHTAFEPTVAERKRLLRRIDIRVLPWLTLLYALSLFDRTNIASARVAGMAEALDLVGNRYNVAVLVFFPTFILVEIPRDSILRRVPVRYYLAGMIFLWGVVAMCCGFTKTFQQLAGLRVILGLFEGGFNPACIYIISAWYCRYETQQRLAVWYVTGSLLNGFNGVISYGLSRMNGVGGLEGWRWIFIIPGIVTIICVVPLMTLLSEFPEKAKWLRPHEQQYVMVEIKKDRGAEAEQFDWRDTLSALADWKVWMLAGLFFWVATGAYSLSFFTPTILRGLGFSVALSQILVTPPYVLAAICSILTGAIADRVKLRSPFIIGYMILTIVGLVMVGWPQNLSVRLVGLFLAIASNGCAIPAVIAFMVNNIPQTKRMAVAIPLQTGFSGLGGIAGALIFRTQDAPRYFFGLYASIVSMSICILCTAVMVAYFVYKNKKADREGMVLEKVEDFRYTL